MCGVEAYFEQDGDLLVPTAHAAGHWAPNTLSGRAALGLASWAFEAALPGPGWLPARLTLDLVQMGRREPVTVTSRLRRSGRTVAVVDLELTQQDRLVALVRGVATHAHTPPPGRTWSRGVAPGSAPGAELGRLEGQQMALATAKGEFSSAGYRSGIAAWQSGKDAPSVCWMRENASVVAGRALTPYTRLGLLADVANSVLNWGSEGLKLINPDLTLSIARLPRGESIGLETVEQVLDTGTSVGTAALHDEEGPFGLVSVTSVHQPVFSGIGG